MLHTVSLVFFLWHQSTVSRTNMKVLLQKFPFIAISLIFAMPNCEQSNKLTINKMGLIYYQSRPHREQKHLAAVILTILGHTEGSSVSQVSEVICFFWHYKKGSHTLLQWTHTCTQTAVQASLPTTEYFRCSYWIWCFSKKIFCWNRNNFQGLFPLPLSLSHIHTKTGRHMQG